MSTARNKKIKKIPIFTASKSLDLKFIFNKEKHEKSFSVVPAADIHAVLFSGVKGVLETRASMLTKNPTKKDKKRMPIYTVPIDDVNFATAAVTFLYTDTTPEEGYLGPQVQQKTVYVTVKCKTDQILSSKDFYTAEYKQPDVTSVKAGRDTTFNHLLTQRLTAFSEISSNYDLPSSVVMTPGALSESIKSPMFHETFHHSEQADMHFLSSAIGLQYLVRNALDCRAAYLYGMTLDIFTERMLCCNCNVCLLGMQNSHAAGFLHDFGLALTKEKVQPRTGDMVLSVRVSAQKGNKSATLDPLRLPEDKCTVHECHPKDLPMVFQAENKTLGTEKIIRDQKLSLNSFPGTFFVSSTFSKDKLETHLRNIRKTIR